MPESLDVLVEKRKAARVRGDYAEADRLRHEIEAVGFTLRDYRDGRTVVKARRPEPKPFARVAHA